MPARHQNLASRFLAILDGAVLPVRSQKARREARLPRNRTLAQQDSARGVSHVRDTRQDQNNVKQDQSVEGQTVTSSGRPEDLDARQPPAHYFGVWGVMLVMHEAAAVPERRGQFGGVGETSRRNLKPRRI